jgi:hypothetical protein
MKAIIHYKGTPLSKQHGTKACVQNGHIRFYPVPDYAAFKLEFHYDALKQCTRQGWRRLEDMPVRISIMFRAPKNLGDISNLIGGIEDALTGVVWHDDCQAILGNCFGIIRDEKEIDLTIVVETFDPALYPGEGVAQGIVDWVKDGLKKKRSKEDRIESRLRKKLKPRKEGK